MKINSSFLFENFLICFLIVGNLNVCTADQLTSADGETSLESLSFGEKFIETSTEEKLRHIKDDPNAGVLARFVANEILDRWNHNEINRTGRIGFWWHVPQSRDTTVVYLHAHCNPLSQPNGPWPIGKGLSLRAVSKSETKTAFTNAGFLVTQDDGSDNDYQPGDRALDFVDRRMVNN